MFLSGYGIHLGTTTKTGALLMEGKLIQTKLQILFVVKFQSSRICKSWFLKSKDLKTIKGCHIPAYCKEDYILQGLKRDKYFKSSVVLLHYISLKNLLSSVNKCCPISNFKEHSQNMIVVLHKIEHQHSLPKWCMI